MNGGDSNDRDPELDPPLPEQISIVDHLTIALNRPPVGLVIVGWAPTGDGTDPYVHRVERSIVFAATACANRSDVLAGAAPDRLAIIRPAIEAPAATEGLAHRIVQRLDTELELAAVEAGRERIEWAVGVAVSHGDDGPDDLLRYATAALDDAWARGGRRLAVFDDEDRGLFEAGLEAD